MSEARGSHLSVQNGTSDDAATTNEIFGEKFLNKERERNNEVYKRMERIDRKINTK